MPETGIAAAANDLAGLLRHAHDIGGMADFSMRGERAMFREKRLQYRLVTEDKKMHFGMAPASNRGTAYDRLGAGIAAHRVDRKG